MRFGISENHLRILDELVVKPLKSHRAQVFIFGSRASGKHHSHSDVDLLYKGEVPPVVLSNIRESIENSGFPYAVDLVNEKDLAESYRENVAKQLTEL